jgi:cyanate lyase
VRLLELDEDVEKALKIFPLKGNGQKVPSDPLIYRLYEIAYVYGSSIKEVVHEKFGDGIMSAIDFTLDVDKVQDPKGNRVQITMSGKFLPYKKW